MVSEVSIISNAFILLGHKAINAFEENDTNHIAARRLYAQLKPELLVRHPWRFAMESKELSRLAESPSVTAWSYAFLFPADPTKILFYRPRPLVDYEIFENKIFTNVNALAMDYIYDVSEDKFPQYFTSALIYYLASRLAMPVTQQVKLSEYWMITSEKMILQAMALDSQQQTNKTIQRDSLITAHTIG